MELCCLLAVIALFPHYLLMPTNKKPKWRESWAMTISKNWTRD
jgi:hypothetical protein